MRYVAIVVVIVVVVSAIVGVLFQARTPAPDEAATAWAQAVVEEDYATARNLSIDDATLFAVWQATTQQAHRDNHLETFTVTQTQRSARTTHFCVEFGGSDPLRPVHFTNIYSDAEGGISAGYPYTPGRCQ